MSSNRKFEFPKDQYEKLGKVPDRVIAEVIGVTTQTVYGYRTAAGIPPYGKHDKSHHTKLSDADFKALVAALGTQRDSILARTFAVSREYVRQLRLKYKIKRFSAQLEA
jgi:hypothetical protein